MNDFKALCNGQDLIILMHRLFHRSYWPITMSVERRSKGRLLNFWIYNSNYFFKLCRTMCWVFHSILSPLITRLEITCAMYTFNSCHYLHHITGSTCSRLFLPFERREANRERSYLYSNHAVSVHPCFWLDNEDTWSKMCQICC